jgi:hypothetical protein
MPSYPSLFGDAIHVAMACRSAPPSSVRRCASSLVCAALPRATEPSVQRVHGGIPRSGQPIILMYLRRRPLAGDLHDAGHESRVRILEG